VRTWGLSDHLFVEMRLRVNSLAENPSTQLDRVAHPFDGMGFRIQLIDPHNRLCQHTFLFHVVYGQDEERLIIARGTYFQVFG
jgi:hypothetical protein